MAAWFTDFRENYEAAYSNYYVSESGQAADEEEEPETPDEPGGGCPGEPVDPNDPNDEDDVEYEDLEYMEHGWNTNSLAWLDIPSTAREIACIGTNPYNYISYGSIIESFYLNQARINTQWDQGSPYNDMCEYFIEGGLSAGTRCSIGCFATAASQIVAYHRYMKGHNFPFEQMTSTPNLQTGTTLGYYAAFLNLLMADLGETKYYLDSGQGEVSTGRVVPAFQEIGYNIERTSGADINILHQNVKAGRPIMMSANSNTQLSKGHIWIVDGMYVAKRYKTYTVVKAGTNNGVPVYVYYLYEVKQQLVLSHMVWGIGGRCDGWYYTFQPRDYSSDHHYKYNKYMYHNIYPLNN